jgi:hypothetical protein
MLKILSFSTLSNVHSFIIEIKVNPNWMKMVISRSNPPISFSWRPLVVKKEWEVLWPKFFEQIWVSSAPSKVIAFSWQLLYDRIPTPKNLEARGVLISERPWECLGCAGKVETTSHLFLHCPCTMLVWLEIFKWIGVSIIIPPSTASLFELLKCAARNVKIRRGFIMIWHATLWSIWKARNNALFASGNFNPRLIVEDIKVVFSSFESGAVFIL